MAVNYLQYIDSVQQEGTPLRFLVSGADAGVRRIVGQDIVSAAYSAGKTLFLVDNTRGTAARTSFGRYRMVSALNGGVCLCGDLLDVNTLAGVSRLRALLTDLGFDSAKAMKVVTYLNFVRETERRLGNTAALTAEVLEQYGGVMLVDRKLEQLVRAGRLSEENRRYLMGRYAEVSGAAADFEAFLVLLAPFLTGGSPRPNTAVRLPVGAFASDRPMQAVLCKLLISYIQQDLCRSAVLILDDGNGGDSGFLIDILKNLPVGAEVHLLSRDAFTFGESDRDVLMNTFPVRIYTRHDNMASCGKIERICGQFDVVRRSSTVTTDHRFRSVSAWDLLLGTNRTETSIANAPSREYRFRKEVIHAFGDGTAILDYAGSTTLFSF